LGNPPPRRPSTAAPSKVIKMFGIRILLLYVVIGLSHLNHGGLIRLPTPYVKRTNIDWTETYQVSITI
jgi:hypothetical protein